MTYYPDQRTIDAMRMLERVVAQKTPPVPEFYAAHLIKHGVPPAAKVFWDIAAGEPKAVYFDITEMYPRQRRCICCGVLESEVQHD